MKNSPPPLGVYRLKIVLRGTKPPIWRRFQVPADIRLDRLHDVIQVVMGWTDSHLHHFLIDGQYYEALMREGIDVGAGGKDEKEFRLNQLVSKEKSKFIYEYDFGDSWEHQLTLEKIVPLEEEAGIYVCLTGKNACPPEDCGGIWGYYEMLDALAEPNHPEHGNLKEWLGEDFDPTAFDLDQINQDLTQLPKA